MLPNKILSKLLTDGGKPFCNVQAYPLTCSTPANTNPAPLAAAQTATALPTTTAQAFGFAINASPKGQAHLI